MYEKFGEFNSVEELNKAADGFKAEGDTVSILELALENGIEEEDAQDFISGESEQFATLAMAAMGKLDVEEKEKNSVSKMALRVVISMIHTIIVEQEMQIAVMKKGKRAKDIVSALEAGAKKHKNGNIGVSCGTDKQLKDIIRAYYLGTKEDMNKKIEDLYK